MFQRWTSRRGMTKRVSGFHTAKCARGGRPQARLSLIENHDHNLNNDKRQLAKNEPLDSVKSRIVFQHDKTSQHPAKGFDTRFTAAKCQEFKRGWLG